MKEVIDDLEWPTGDVEILMQRDPQLLSLSASGTGTLQVSEGPPGDVMNPPTAFS